MNKKAKIALTVLYSGFFASSLFCFLIDGIMSVVQPIPGEPKLNLGTSLEGQLMFISVGSALLVSVGGLLNLIALGVKMPKGISSKNNFTFLISIVTLIFIIYGGAMAIGTDILGFNSGYRILKSIIEHFFNPVVLIVMYFVFSTEVVKTKHYCRTDAGYVMIFISVYIISIIIREAIVRSTGDDTLQPFPYKQIDPGTAPAYFGILGMLAFEFVPYGLEIAYNALSNLSAKRMAKILQK